MERIVCLGDWGSEPLQYQSEFFQKFSYDRIYLLCDNFYPNGVTSTHDEQWESKLNVLFPSQIPKHVCLGNHDYNGNVNAQMMYSKFEKNWNCPFFYHDVKHHAVSAHTFFIDTQIMAPAFTYYLLQACDVPSHVVGLYTFIQQSYIEKQFQWLETSLQNSNARWKIVCGHYPIFSNGPHECALELKQRLLSLLEKYKVDLYISGHDHNVQCIRKNGIHFLVSGNIFPVGYPITKTFERDTVYCNDTDPMVVYLEIQEHSLYVYAVNCLDSTKHLINILIKQ